MICYVLLLFFCVVLVDLMFYVQGGMGYQIGMIECWIYESECYFGEYMMDLLFLVGLVEVGISYCNWFIQGQYVSSVEMGQDYGFNVISVGYWWEWEL